MGGRASDSGADCQAVQGRFLSWLGVAGWRPAVPQTCVCRDPVGAVVFGETPGGRAVSVIQVLSQMPLIDPGCPTPLSLVCSPPDCGGRFCLGRSMGSSSHSS